LLTSAAIHSVRNSPIRSGAHAGEADPEPAMPRFSSLRAGPSRLNRLTSAAKAALVHEPGQAVTEALRQDLAVVLAGHSTEVTSNDFPVGGMSLPFGAAVGARCT
jgi:hypothetical protein